MELGAITILSLGYLLIPVLGLQWMAAKRERERNQRLLRDAIRLSYRLSRSGRRLG